MYPSLAFPAFAKFARRILPERRRTCQGYGCLELRTPRSHFQCLGGLQPSRSLSRLLNISTQGRQSISRSSRPRKQRTLTAIPRRVSAGVIAMSRSISSRRPCTRLLVAPSRVCSKVEKSRIQRRSSCSNRLSPRSVLDWVARPLRIRMLRSYLRSSILRAAPALTGSRIDHEDFILLSVSQARKIIAPWIGRV